MTTATVLDSLHQPDMARRFGGVARLYGADGLAKLQSAHMCVIGIGGVGSWAAEALARNAVGNITLIDLDNVAESNVNRQLHALGNTFGKAKVTAMHERILAINPSANVLEVEEFVTVENVATMLSQSYDYVIDCVDDAKAKVAIATYCRARKLPLVTVGAAGGRLDPTRIQVADLAHVSGDRLLAKVRNQLRRDHQFPKATNSKKSDKFGIQAVYSDEPVIKPDAACEVESNTGVTGLNCAGYGSSVCVTAPFGFTASAIALKSFLFK